jgi:hypothetical protein
MSSTPPSELTQEALQAAFPHRLNLAVTGLERIGGGKNSQVYKITLASDSAANFDKSVGAARCADLQPSTLNLHPGAFALKAYFRQANDQRDRLATEYNSFSHLWVNGFRQIPQPLACDTTRGWAFYQFIDGDKIPPGQANDAQVLAAVDFLARLRELSRQPESRNLGVASEAYFVPRLMVENLRRRLQHLQQETANQLAAIAKPHHASSSSDSTPYGALHDFLAAEFVPFLAEVTHWSENRLTNAGMSFTEELDLPHRTLSPSDFGFHNALRQPDGHIIFLDFEYFGWDDPAKMIADFLLHPAMNLSAAAKRTFASETFRRFADWPALVARVESVYPLFGLKWCLIMLNEFLPDSYARRQFAAATVVDRSSVLRQQLDKARGMLERIRKEYREFPYRD